MSRNKLLGKDSGGENNHDEGFNELHLSRIINFIIFELYLKDMMELPYLLLIILRKKFDQSLWKIQIQRKFQLIRMTEEITLSINLKVNSMKFVCN
jgi:hypothetical protein